MQKWLFLLALILLAVLFSWFVLGPNGVHEQEGMADLTQYSDSIGKMFMSPTESKTSENTVKIKKTKYDPQTKKSVPQDFYVPKGWYIVMIKEMIENPTNPNQPKLAIDVARMTKLDAACKLDAKGNVVPKDSKKKTPNCLTSLDISTLKTSKAISNKMNANTKSGIDFFYQQYPEQTSSFFSRDAMSKTDKELKKDFTEFEKAQKAGDFQGSEKALEAAKKEFDKSGALGKKTEKPAKFDVSKNLLQYDAAMPIFWDQALLSNQGDSLMPIFFEPGSFRNVGKTYVPSYEDSVFLSQLTGLPEYAAVKNTPDQMKGFCTQLGSDKDAWEQKCNSLSPDVCASTECCALLGGSKCVASNVNGPIISSNYSDTTIQNRDFYYFQGKCYGNCYQNGASSMYIDGASKHLAKDAVTALADAYDQVKASIMTTSPETVAKKPKTTKFKVGDVVDAIYMLTSGAKSPTSKTGDAQTYKAKITKDLADNRWQIEWQEGPMKGQIDAIQKDTLQAIMSSQLKAFVDSEPNLKKYLGKWKTAIKNPPSKVTTNDMLATLKKDEASFIKDQTIEGASLKQATKTEDERLKKEMLALFQYLRGVITPPSAKK
jgi:hypothetical protein